MKTPLSSPIKPKIQSLTSTRSNLHSPMAENTGKKEIASFNEILTKKIENSKLSDDSPGSTQQLTRDQLMKLIEIMRIKMHEYMISELGVFSLNSDFVLDRLTWINQPELIPQSGSLISKPEYSPPHAVNTKITNTVSSGSSVTSGGSVNSNDSIGSVNSYGSIDSIIEHASKVHKINPKLISAVIKAESNFNPESTSRSGAKGLMQLMPETALEMGVKNPYDPIDNIMGGSRYLKMLLDRYEGDIPLSLAAYNWGMGNVERTPDKLPKETLSYISKVNKFLNDYDKA